MALATEPLDATLDYARTKEADIVLIGEFPWGKPLTDAYAPSYPFRADTGTHPADPYRRTRVVALSRLPVDNVQAIAPGDYSGRRFLTFDVHAGGDVHSGGNERLLQIASAHVLLPMRAESHAAQPAFIGAMAAALREPFLIAADLNATPGSRAYNLLPGKRIGDPRWETTYAGFGPMRLGLSIDHFLVSKQVGVTEYELGPDTGAKHRPLFAAIRPKESKRSGAGR